MQITERSRLEESRSSLWTLVAAPIAWVLHFLFVYAAAALWCAKAEDPDMSATSIRAVVAISSAAAFAAIWIVGRRGWSHHRFGDAALPHDFDSPDDRHRFLGFATVLLAGLSGIAVAFEAIAVLLAGSCR